jgi:hypothetical protein
MSYDARAQALRCPFCGSERLQKQPDIQALGPNRVLPLVVDEGTAAAALRKWLGKGFWRPGDLSQRASVTKMTAVYVPYWVFTAQTYTFWTADSSQTPRGARSDWFPMSGETRGTYTGVLIGASSVLTPAETSALAPFDLDQAVPPEQVDLDPIVVEPFCVQRKYARPLAMHSLEQLEQAACRAFVPGQCRNLKVNVRLEGLSSEPVLLPVWIMAYRYQDKLYRFLLNGQTGRAIGQAPTSWKKMAAAVALAALGILLALLCTGVLGAIFAR